MLEQLIATNIIIGKVAVSLWGLSFCIASIAFMPNGVAAPLIPSKFADMFIETYCLLSAERLFLPNILFIIGDRRWDNFFDNPLCSKILNSPTQIAYTAQSSSESFTALLDAVKRPDKTLVGLLKHRAIRLEMKSIIQILFILKNMICLLKI